MKFLGIIPARYASTRLEGKPLRDICGHSMIAWVYTRCLQSKVDDLIVATDDERIAEEVRSIGGKVMMTRKDHPNGSSRIAEVCEAYPDYDVVINIQGDEPLIEVDMINALVEAFEKEDLEMATLKHELKDWKDIENPNQVKVITDVNDFAIYFSRSVIPYPRNKGAMKYYKHVGIYAYRRDFLLDYAAMKPSALEETESLEQLRVLESGHRIKVLETTKNSIGVDTQEDLEKVCRTIQERGIHFEV